MLLTFLFFKNNSGSGSEIQFLSEAQDDPQKRKPDIRKAKLMLGWEPVVSVALGQKVAPSPPAFMSSQGRPLLGSPQWSRRGSSIGADQ